MRLFVATDLSDDARRAIAGEQKRIAAALAGAPSTLRWIPADQMHVTLVFLGEIEEARVPAIVDAVGRGVDAQPFDVTFAGGGVFPPDRAPRALWIGTSDGANALTVLQQEIARRLVPLGVAAEDRRFSPHLTIGRWRSSRPSDARHAVAALRHGPIARAPVAHATLYHSRMSSSGSTYVPLTHANLTRI